MKMKLYSAAELTRYDVVYKIGAKQFTITIYAPDAGFAGRQVRAYAVARRSTAPVEHRNDKIRITNIEATEE